VVLGVTLALIPIFWSWKQTLQALADGRFGAELVDLAVLTSVRE
jgi:hypothetical protein